MGDDIMDMVNLIGNVGFPIAVSLYLLVRIEGKLENLTNSINELTNVMTKLEKEDLKSVR